MRALQASHGLPALAVVNDDADGVDTTVSILAYISLAVRHGGGPLSYRCSINPPR
jgi:hypothetical protein